MMKVLSVDEKHNDKNKHVSYHASYNILELSNVLILSFILGRVFLIVLPNTFIGQKFGYR